MSFSSNVFASPPARAWAMAAPSALEMSTLAIWSIAAGAAGMTGCTALVFLRIDWSVLWCTGRIASGTTIFRSSVLWARMTCATCVSLSRLLGYCRLLEQPGHYLGRYCTCAWGRRRGTTVVGRFVYLHGFIAGTSPAYPPLDTNTSWCRGWRWTAVG